VNQNGVEPLQNREGRERRYYYNCHYLYLSIGITFVIALPIDGDVLIVVSVDINAVHSC